MKKASFKISFNSPVILSFTIICVIAQIINSITDGAAGHVLFSVYRAPVTDLLAYVRCLTHVFGHASWDHLFGNMMYILILGPALEEKYGSVNITVVMFITALMTAIINLIFFPSVALLGASGIVFAFILLSSITRVEEHAIPLTLILVAALYIGREVYDAVLVSDNVSHLSHILGGLVGTVSGFTFAKVRKKK